MSNPLYQEMMGKTQQSNPIQMLSQLRSNPIQFILQQGFNLPKNIGTNPNSIIQYLMNSGQVTQDQYNNAVRMAQNFGQFRR